VGVPDNEPRHKWRYITYYWPCRLLWLWRWLFCRRGWHLFDEVLSSWDDGPAHYLYCDACELIVHIDDRRVKGLG
jgi:hypothetical protein